MSDIGWNTVLSTNLTLWRWLPDGYSIVKVRAYGADPTVRADFRRAMAALDNQSQQSVPGRSGAPLQAAFTPRQTDERPDPVALVDALAHLATALPD
jgi:hypothetical protein